MEPHPDILLLITTANGDEFSMSFGEDQQSLFLQSKDLDAGLVDDGRVVQDPRMSKFIYRVVTKIRDRVGALNLRMRLQYRNDLNEPRVEFPEVIDLSQEIDYYKLRTPGAKYFSFRIEDPVVVNNWKLSEVKFEGTIGGSRL